jgi:uncharacterized small protein (DUF1192 family)
MANYEKLAPLDLMLVNWGSFPLLELQAFRDSCQKAMDSIRSSEKSGLSVVLWYGLVTSLDNRIKNLDKKIARLKSQQSEATVAA